MLAFVGEEFLFFSILLAVGTFFVWVGLWKVSRERNVILQEKLGLIEVALKEIAASMKQPK